MSSNAIENYVAIPIISGITGGAITYVTSSPLSVSSEVGGLLGFLLFFSVTFIIDVRESIGWAEGLLTSKGLISLIFYSIGLILVNFESWVGFIILVIIVFLVSQYMNEKWKW
jgi:hypothetical protein